MLGLLGKTNILTQLDASYQQNIIRFNEKVRENRYILKRLISCVKSCSAFELALKGHDESSQSLKKGIFKGELVDFSAKLDARLNVTLRQHLRNAIVFKGASKAILDDILDCMLTCCKDEISTLIKKFDFLPSSVMKLQTLQTGIRWF
nr:unnamed protein product [Callosobruchus chinensis]